MGARPTAVVIGGSIAGLFAGAALSESFERVTIVDRDDLPEGPHPHQGVPQGSHIHLLLPIGLQRAVELLPGLDQRLAADGAPTIDFCRDLAGAGPGGWGARTESGVPLTCSTRHLLEWVVRQLVRERPNVEIRQGAVAGLELYEDNRRVTGVRLKGDAGETLSADLVVDASGRGSKSPKWLRESGFDTPAEQHVRIHMGYTSQIVHVPDGLLPAGVAGISAVSFPPHQVHGSALVPVENGNHLLVAAGMLKNYPPRDREGVISFLRDVSTPVIAEYAAEMEWVTEPSSYHMPGSQRRRWEDLERRPEGFIAVGDSVASMNPIYGQGMTQAILAAGTLRDELASRDGDLDGFAGAFHQALSPVTDLAFHQAAGSDAAYEGAEVENVTLEPPPNAAYFGQVAALRTQDPDVSAAFMRMAGYLDPSAIMAPSIVAKVEAWVAAGSPMTRNTDLSVVPDVQVREPVA